MTHNAANVEWRQVPGDEASLEVRIPIILPPGVKASREISVTVGDLDVVIVKFKESKLWQCRLYAAIKPEIEWHVENESVLILDIQKKTPETWPALLNLPLPKQDTHLLSEAQLDERIQWELPRLPTEEELQQEALLNSDKAATDDEDAEKDGEEKEDGDEDGSAPTGEAEEKSEEETAADKEDADAAADVAAEEKAEEADGEDKETPAAEAPAAETAAPAAAADDEDDLDKLLDDAVEEVVSGKEKSSTAAAAVAAVDGEAAEKKTATASSSAVTETKTKVDEKKKDDESAEEKAAKAALSMQTEAELRGIEMENKSILAKIEQLIEELKTVEVGSEEHKTYTLHMDIASKMLEAGRESRRLRSQPASIQNFLKIQQLDLIKARLNIGELKPTETEEFQSEEEKQLTGLQLFMAGVQQLQTDPAEAVHLLRLAAVHHHHSPSILALFSIYCNVASSFPRGASLLIGNAIRGDQPGEERDMRSNSKVGDMFNAGTRHFPPIFAMAVYFHQRAAELGSSHSLINLAVLHLAGECTGDSMMPAPIKQRNTSVERANYFIQCALDRGCIAAYLIRAMQYALGRDGIEKNITMAKKYYDKAVLAEASVKSNKDMMIGGAMSIGDLERLFDGPAGAAASGAAATSAKKANDDDFEEMRPTTTTTAAKTAAVAAPISAASRLEALSRASAATTAQGNGTVATGGAGLAVPAKRTTFVGSAAKTRAFWERAARWGTGLYAVYVLAFPLRVIMLPFFYETVARILDVIGLSSTTSSSHNAGAMLF